MKPVRLASIMDTTPSKKHPRTKPADVRREELMDAAQSLFLEKGFEGTSVDEIVRAANVAKGTFYLHFRSKAEILVALQERFVSEFCRELEAALSGGAALSWSARLDLWLEAAVNGYLDRVAIHDLVFHEFGPAKRHMKHDNPVLSLLTSFLSDGARAGAWVMGEPRLTAVMMFNALHSAVDETLVDDAPVDRAALTGECRVFCRRALGLPGN